MQGQAFRRAVLGRCKDFSLNVDLFLASIGLLRENSAIDIQEANLGRKTFKVQSVAKLLGISVDSVRRDADEASLQIERQGGSGPKTRIFTVENVFDLAAYRARKYNLAPKLKRILTVYAPKGGVGKT